ncbi:hypothetical protein ACTU3I_18045 [Microbacterium sp. RD1]|uniref:hypothetical protein n=1 Tax=Microbacterium sp. RD1 TaxID=3457313 RepID=UPI003FA5C794
MPSPFVYFADAPLSGAELSAACLDGDLIALGEGYVPADLVESPGLRASSLAAMLGGLLAATHVTAAWVHGAIDEPPPRHTVQRAVPRRLHHIIDRRLVYRDTRVPARDLLLLGGVPVTTVARTVADLARMPGPEHPAVLRAWGERDPDALERGRAWLVAQERLPSRRAADEMLCALQSASVRKT